MVLTKILAVLAENLRELNWPGYRRDKRRLSAHASVHHCVGVTSRSSGDWVPVKRPWAK